MSFIRWRKGGQSSTLRIYMRLYLCMHITSWIAMGFWRGWGVREDQECIGASSTDGHGMSMGMQGISD
jgi:hypothetical protein